MSRTISKGYFTKSVTDFIGISRQAFHKRLKKKFKRNDIYNYAEEKVIKNREVKSRAGLRSIFHKEQLSSLLGINQFEQQMSLRGYALKPYKSYIKTTDSRGHQYKFPNLIAGMNIRAANKVIVGDITYYRSDNGTLYYIFHFLDYYTLEIKGLVGSKNMDGLNAEKCLRQVFAYNKRRKYEHEMILHTDGGGQYRSHKFQKMLRQAQVRPSQATNCLENGLSERENGIVKNDYLIDYDIKSISHLSSVLKIIKFQINQVWPSKTLGYRTPSQYAHWINTQEETERPVKIVTEF